MKKSSAAACLLAVFFSIPAAAEVSPSDGRGVIVPEGTVQFLWEMVQSDPARDQEAVERFVTRRVHAGFHGRPDPMVDYRLTMSLKDGATFETGVYEAYVDVNPVHWLRLRAGSFRPPWTLTMPRDVHELRFVRYPLIVEHDEWLFTPWMQTGFMLSFAPGDNVELSGGVFNGIDASNLFVDNNAMKDMAVFGRVAVFEGVDFHLGHWGGRTDFDSRTVAAGETLERPFGLSVENGTTADVEVPGGVIDHSNVWAALEVDRGPFYFAGESAWHRADVDGSRRSETRGYQFSLGYTVNVFQWLARYELFDPDARDGDDDELEWTTIGLNVSPDPNVKLMTNYVFKSERGDNHRANDEFTVQLSVRW